MLSRCYNSKYVWTPYWHQCNLTHTDDKKPSLDEEAQFELDTWNLSFESTNTVAFYSWWKWDIGNTF